MANNKNTAPETQNSIDNLNEALTDMSRKVESNKKPIIIAVIVILIVTGAILFFKHNSTKSSEQADNAIGNADFSLMEGNDSIALEQYKQVAEMGSDAGNRAALNAAIILYKDKKYDEAINYINKYDPRENIIGAAAYSLKGDCYVNLKNYPEAVKAFKDAIKQSDKNAYYTPYFMLKLARVYRAQEDYKAEAGIYEEISKDYPAYAQNNNINIEKYLERARLDAEKK